MSSRARKLKVVTTDIIKSATSAHSSDKKRRILGDQKSDTDILQQDMSIGKLIDLDSEGDGGDDDLDLSASVAAGTMKKRKIRKSDRLPLSSLFIEPQSLGSGNDAFDVRGGSEEDNVIVQLYDGNNNNTDTASTLSTLDVSSRKRRSKHGKSNHRSFSARQLRQQQQQQSNNSDSDDPSEPFAQQKQLEDDTTDGDEIEDYEEEGEKNDDDKYDITSRESNADYWDRNCRYGGFKDCLCRALCCRTIRDDGEDEPEDNDVRRTRAPTVKRVSTTTRWTIFWWWVVKIIFYLVFGVFGAFIQRLVIYFTTGSTAYEIGKMQVIDIPSWGDVLMGFCFSAVAMLLDITLSRMFKDWIRGWTGIWAETVVVPSAATPTAIPTQSPFDRGYDGDISDNINNIRTINELR